MRDWFAGLSWLSVFVYFALAFGLLFWVIGGFGGEPAAPTAIIPALLGGVVFSALMTPLTMWRRRRSTPTHQPPIPISLALRDGTLPGLINPDTWLPALEARAAIDRSLRRTGIVLIVVGSLLLILGIVNHNWVGWTILGALLIAVSVWRIVDARLELPKIAKLQAEIRSTYNLTSD
jgi:uncharacterized protein YjeT (DUF2065 family)